MSTESTDAPISSGSPSTADSAPADVGDHPSLSPAAGGGAADGQVSRDSGRTNGATNDHDHDKPTTLQAWREQKRKEREEREAAAERESASAQPADRPAESDRPTAAQEAPSPAAPTPMRGEDKVLSDDDFLDVYASIKSTLPPEQAERAISRLSEAMTNGKAALAQIDAHVKQVQLNFEHSVAQLQANSSVIHMTDLNARQQFEQQFGVPMSVEGLHHLYATNPEMAAAAMATKLTHDAQMEVLRHEHQRHQDIIANNDRVTAAMGDRRLADQLRRTDPDLLDGDKIKPEFQQAAHAYLTEEAGLDPRTIRELWANNTKVPIRDARFQKMLLDAARYRSAKSKAAVAVKKAMPEVQKPGRGRGGGSSHLEGKIAALESKGSLTLREAAKLNQMRRMRG